VAVSIWQRTGLEEDIAVAVARSFVQLTAIGFLINFIFDQDRLVFVAHANALKDDLAAGEALAFLLRIHGRPFDGATLDAALDRLGILSRRDAPVRTLSQGQRRRVALARLAVEQRPTLWLLDEPFDALDTDGLSRVNAVLAGHLYRGGSIMLTSHLDLDTAVLHPIELDLDRASSLAKP